MAGIARETGRLLTSGRNDHFSRRSFRDRFALQVVRHHSGRLANEAFAAEMELAGVRGVVEQDKLAPQRGQREDQHPRGLARPRMVEFVLATDDQFDAGVPIPTRGCLFRRATRLRVLTHV